MPKNIATQGRPSCVGMLNKQLVDLISAMPRLLTILLLSFLSVNCTFAQQNEPDALPPSDGDDQRLVHFDERLTTIRQQIIDFRRDLHQHPEVSGQEKRTAGAVTDRLKSLGLEIKTGVGGHGVVGLLRGKNPGPAIAFRADMDAVYSNEPDPVSFASTNPGIRHICGHDIHTSVGVALAEGLAAIKDDLNGSVYFIFQPAEENVQGARAMLKDGVFDAEMPDAIFAYHTAPMEAGQIATKSGAMLAGRDNLSVTLRGNTDLLTTAKSVQTIVQDLNTVEPGQTSVAGDFFLVRAMPPQPGGVDTQLIRAFVTTTSDAIRTQKQQELRSKLDKSLPEGMSYELEYSEVAAGVNNDPTLEASTHTAIKSVIGANNLIPLSTVPTAFSEDFGSFQQQVPGVMYFLGVSNSEKGWVGMPHSPNYVADEEAIFVGAKAMAAVMLAIMDEAQ